MQLVYVWVEDDWYWPLQHELQESLESLSPAPHVVDDEDKEAPPVVETPTLGMLTPPEKALVTSEPVLPVT